MHEAIVAVPYVIEEIDEGIRERLPRDSKLRNKKEIYFNTKEKVYGTRKEAAGSPKEIAWVLLGNL